MTMPWSTSNRRSRLPRDWPARVAATKQRARGRCEATIHDPRCDGCGRECDHRNPGDDHELSNLQWLSTPCHRAKTQAESQAARIPRQRPKPPHPGVIP